MRRSILFATLAAAAALRLPSSPLPPSPRASSPRMDAISDVAALLGMTDPDEKKAVVQRLSEERGLDPTGRIEELISQNKVMLFIKGTKAFPQCGFSMHCLVKFSTKFPRKRLLVQGLGARPPAS